MHGSVPERSIRAGGRQRGGLLGLALVMLLVAVVVATGVAALVGAGAMTGSDRVLGEKALFAAESGILLLRAGEDAPDCDGSPYPVGDRAGFECTPPDSEPCGDTNRSLVRGWAGTGDPSQATVVHSLCVSLRGGIGAGSDADSLPPTVSMGNSGQRTNARLETSGAASVSGNGQGHVLDEISIVADGSVSVSLGASSRITDTSIDAGGAVSVNMGQGSVVENAIIEAGGDVSVSLGNNSTIDCLLILAPSADVSGQGSTTFDQGVDYFLDAGEAESAGCNLQGDGRLDWGYQVS